ncbi:MAG: hypothetical protein JXX14_18405, partial [Deltaproteobacteria bacterium]|nr:hypothetical protein [Deltaproteobacteria bacterium]
ACAGTTDFAFHVAKTAFCDSLFLGHDGCFLNGKIRVIAIFQAKDLTYVKGLGDNRDNFHPESRQNRDKIATHSGPAVD